MTSIAGALTELSGPPFPKYEIIYPVPLTYLETMQSEEFWSINFQNFGMLRLKPVSGAYRVTEFGDNPWQVVKGGDLEAVQQTRTIPRALAALLELTPEQREVQERQLRSEAIQFLQDAIDHRRRQTTELMAKSELLERSKGNVPNPELFAQAMILMEHLEQMLLIHEMVVTRLLEIEATSKTVLVGGYHISTFCMGMLLIAS
jgi:hypothetical protein